MQQIIRAILIVIGIHIFPFHQLHAQLNTLSPYTRYGLGDINEAGFGRNDALGGITAPLRTSNIINPGNPASYSSQDTLSFIFDVGFKSRLSTYETSTDKREFNNSMLDHIALGFPITRWLKASAGIYPFSYSGYNIQEVAVPDQTAGEDSVMQNFTGEGGLNSVYIGTGFSINDYVSLGVNLKYMFGNLDHFNSLALIDDEFYTTQTNRRQETQISGLYYDLGAQYEQNFGKNKWQAGVYFRPEINVTGKYDQQVLNQSLYLGQLLFSDTLVNNNANENLALPMQFKIGAAYTFNNKLLIALEYDFEEWSSFRFPGIQGNLENSQDYRIGIEYIPDPTSLTGYFNHVSFRAGGYYSNTYLKLNTKQITDRGVTAGIGLPVRGSRTTFNISYRYGMNGTTNSGLMQETYHQFKVSLSMYDFWFIQSKYD
ncbi:MAG: hypothetical protein GVY19_01705 [Bacteroidetes bacterium]|jgi:hypothetical protein|nr:hypothetical protein [Bacteroidota bacterium]